MSVARQTADIPRLAFERITGLIPAARARSPIARVLVACVLANSLASTN